MLIRYYFTVLNGEETQKLLAVVLNSSIRMKLFLGICVIFFAGAYAQTVTDEFLTAQTDLSTGHEFFETAIFINRGQVSAYLYRINREIITSHIDTYAFIKNYGLQAKADLEALERTEQNEVCLNNILNRWDLQVTR